METVKVLALNDDNHDRSYVTIDKYFSNCADFAKACLLNPHNSKYEVREVYVCDPQGQLSTLTEDSFNEAFELLDQPLRYVPAEKLELRKEIFNLFWENGEDWIYA